MRLTFAQPFFVIPHCEVTVFNNSAMLVEGAKISYLGTYK